MAPIITMPRLMAVGGGALAELPGILQRLGLTNPLIVTDPFLVRSGHLERVTKILDDAGVRWRVFSDTVPDPTTAVVAASARRLAEDSYDSLVAIGGGSSIDTAKGMSVLTANGGQMRDYKVPAEIPKAGPPIVGGATTAGMAFSNASVALVHGMSRPIGAFFHVPHGLSNAMLLPEITAFSAPAALERYADCARAMGIAEEGEGRQAAVARLLDELRRLNADLQVPTPRSWGIDAARYEELLPVMASQALASGSPANNPRVPTSEEIVDLYRRGYG